jgi:hypothetical protein
MCSSDAFWYRYVPLLVQGTAPVIWALRMAGAAFADLVPRPGRALFALFHYFCNMTRHLGVVSP